MTATIGDLLHSEPRWFWAHCVNQSCLHKRPIALAPFAIRWGMDASTDVIRRNLVCELCGRKGCELKHPSWVDLVIGWQPFPAASAP